MDIAIVHHLPSAGGAPRVIAEYVARRPEHAFTVYTRRPEPAPGEALVGLPARVPVRRFPLPPAQSSLARLRQLWAVPQHGRDLARRVDDGGHDTVFVHPSELVQAHEVLPYLRTPSLFYAPEALRSAHEPPPAFARSDDLRSRLARSGLHPYERRRRALDRRHIRAAGRVVTHSRFTAAQLRRVYGVSAEVVPLGVDADVFSPDEATAREDYVLSVGALHPLKGHQFVVEALATLPAPTRPPLVVVGDRGDAAGPLQELAGRLGVHLTILQSIPLHDLVERYRRAAVLACGQIREPFGLISLEGMATATAVVAVDEGGLAETIRDGVTGLLAPRDADAFGRALRRVVEDRALAARLGEAGRVAAEWEWTWERTADGFDRLLEAVAGRRP